MKVFDNYEISPCRRYEEPDKPGHFYFEVCERAEADCWTLYGHIDGEGVEAIADCQTEQQAQDLYQRITGAPFGTHEENAARVRLMHAAPKLLAAIEPLVKHGREQIELAYSAGENDNAEQLERDYQAIFEAHAAATGEAA
ncbi:hypothetical protein [Tautonia plasticadhaerens]|uniref:Uncharacterized protein n=1 Tax=Tautonia plasticadhaerens TaxID=2527974 RepID=A0A518H2A3_9BACT|nr:hypothetical protein [Tautonia plasticadhaerens]QDV34955.1 hypothetical protein ElP_28520 [Tautonia plasticadhaerens]